MRLHVTTNAKVSDRSQQPLTLNLSLSESAGTGSLHRLGAPDMSVNWRGESPRVREHRCPAGSHGQQDDASARARQLRDREVPWEGSLTQT